MHPYTSATRARTTLSLLVAFATLATFVAPATAHHHGHENEPYVVTNDWDGFVACAVDTPAASRAPCKTLDPNDDVEHRAQLDAGIETVVLALDWDPRGGISDDRLQLRIDDELGHTYARIEGRTPLELRFDDLPDNGTELRFHVLASSQSVGFVYQQPFTLYHHHFYHAHAPAGYSALPDA